MTIKSRIMSTYSIFKRNPNLKFASINVLNKIIAMSSVLAEITWYENGSKFTVLHNMEKYVFRWQHRGRVDLSINQTKVESYLEIRE